MDLKVGSINVRGLGDRLKRQEIFNWLKTQKHVNIFYSRSSLYGRQCARLAS